MSTGRNNSVNTNMLPMLSIITFPSYSDVINTTTTAFGGSLLTDLLPWAGGLLVIVVAGMGLAAVVRKIYGAIKKILGGGKRRGKRRFR